MSAEATFVAAIVVILLASRLLGEAAQRIGQPAVIGQLVAGILLGPSLFGLVWPEAQHAVFLRDSTHKAMLDAIAQFGVLLLLLLTGMDTDLKLIRRVGRPALSVSALGILAPFLCGVMLGFLAPSEFLPNPERRLSTALFLGVALSISSIKIVAMVVNDMNFGRRDWVSSSSPRPSSRILGMILIAIIFGIANTGQADVSQFAWNVGGVAAFLAISLTLGRRVVSIGIQLVNDYFVSEFAVVTLILVIMGTMALITQALGVQTVLGAFIAGVLVGKSPILTKHIAGQLRGMVASFFAPVFFALAGLNSDITLLRNSTAVILTLALILIASIGKFVGAFIGGAIGRLSRSESFALAVGMNARGSTEVIVASIGLSIGALTQNLYSMIVTMAVVTTCAMPPTLRWALARTPFRPGERERLEREAFEAKGFVANMERFLVAASESANGRLASRLAGLLAGSRGQPITMLKIGTRSAELVQLIPTNDTALDLAQAANVARGARPEDAIRASDIAVRTGTAQVALAQTLSDEAPKGYDFLVMGLDPVQARGGGFNPEISASARSFAGPLAVAIARGVHDGDPAGAQGRILSRLPVPSTRATARRLPSSSLAPPARPCRFYLCLGAHRRHRPFRRNNGGS